MLMAWASQQYAMEGYLPEDLESVRAVIRGYWDAEYTAGLTLSGSQISAWENTITGEPLSQAVGGSRPILNATAFNGRPAAVFDGIDDFLGLEQVELPIGAEGCEMFGAGTCPSGAVDTALRMLIAYGGTGATNTRRLYRLASTGNSRATLSVGTGGATTTLSITSPEFVGPGYLRGEATPTQATLQIVPDGTSLGPSAAVPATATTRTRMGSNTTNGAGNYWSGTINCVIVTDPLTVGQRATIEAFLAGRL
jgi:hypothetical protein